MADDNTHPGMAIRRGIVHGPRPVGALIPAVTRATFKRHSPAAAHVIADWPLIVGERLATLTSPRRLDRGVLTITCSGPTAMDLHYSSTELIQRINAHLGGQLVQSLRFTQAGTPASPKPVPRPPPEAVEAAEAAVADLPTGELRSALASLGRVVLGRSRFSARRANKR